MQPSDHSLFFSFVTNYMIACSFAECAYELAVQKFAAAHYEYLICIDNCSIHASLEQPN